MASVLGLDLSVAQPRCDWNKIAASGRQFAYLRATYAEHQDGSFAVHAKDASGPMPYLGAYSFIVPSSDPYKDVKAFLAAIDGHPLNLPAAMDMEAMQGCSPQQVIDHVEMWAYCYQEAKGHLPVFYTGPAFANSVGFPAEFANYRLFIANYGVRAPMVPKPWNHWDLWQYAANTIWRDSTGKQGWGKAPPGASIIANPGIVPGVPGECDCDMFNGDLDAFRSTMGVI